MSFKNPVVIVGLGGCFPGADTPDAYWGLIQRAANMAQPMPTDRSLLPIQTFHQPGEPQADKVTGTHGCFLDAATLDLDYQLLQIDPELVEALDPSFKLALYAASEAWKDAHLDSVPRDRISLVLGNIVLPTDHASRLTREYLGGTLASKALGRSLQTEPAEPTHPYDTRPAGLPGAVVAKALGIGGGSLCLDAACASSLFALKLATDDLLAHRVDAVLTGGLSRPDCLYTQMGFSQLRALSATGLPAPFDARGNGLVVGEGCGMFVLKRLQDALSAGDRIYGVIEGIGLSNDTDGSLLAPSSEGQLRAMRAAYAQAGWSVDDLDLVECHATGTPLGDLVEFQSLCQLWQDTAYQPGQCVIGSVKGTIGHLLTAAGSASLMKVLLAMQAEQLPPTSNFKSPQTAMNFERAPFRVLTQPEPWQRNQRPRRAAVSAFGFGGTNAHVLVSQYEPELWQVEDNPPHPSVPVAIVGIGGAFGPWSHSDKLAERILGLAEPSEPLEPSWTEGHIDRGYFVRNLQLPFGKYRIPPNELKEMLPQQLLFLQVASEALEDARFANHDNDTCGVFVGIGLDLNTTNYQLRWDLPQKAAAWNKQFNLGLDDQQLADWVSQLRAAASPALNANRVLGGLGGLVGSRAAREFRFGGPCLSLSSEEGSGLQALDHAVRLLQKGELRAALVGAVDLAGDVRLLQHRETTAAPGEGAVAFVLKRLADAQADGDTIYAVIEQPVCADSTPDLAPTRAYLQRHATQASLLFETCCHQPVALVQAMTPCLPVEPNVSAVETLIGHTGAAAGLASVYAAVLALHHRILPPNPACFKETAPLPYPVASSPRHWLRDRASGARTALVTCQASDGSFASVFLQGYDAHVRPETALPPLKHTLIPVFAQQASQLVPAIAQLLKWLDSTEERAIHRIGKLWWSQHPAASAGAAIVFLPQSFDELRAFAQTAQAALASSDPRQAPGFLELLDAEKVIWREQPLGPNAPIAFVYPGSGSHFHGMGRPLALRWPHPFLDQDSRTDYLADQLRPDLFWADQPPAQIGHEQRALLSAQVSLDIALTNLLQAFDIKPNAVIGYSLGETSGLYATQAWKEHDVMHERTRQSDLFNTALAGECTAVREFWQLGPDEHVDWTVGVITRGADEVRPLLAGHKRVYLLIINTPRECVIGGNREAVKAFVSQIRARFYPLSGVVSVHCEVVTPVADRYRQHHILPTHVNPGVTYYSGARGEAYPLTSENAADSVLANALYGVDFPKTIRSAYADGFPIFIEIGPGASCTRMIGEILGNQPHLARTICQAGSEPERKFLAVLGNLIAEGIPVKLDYLFTSQKEERPAPARTFDVTVGLTPFQVAPVAAQQPQTTQALPAPVGQAIPEPVAQSIPQPLPLAAQPTAPKPPNVSAAEPAPLWHRESHPEPAPAPLYQSLHQQPVPESALGTADFTAALAFPNLITPFAPGETLPSFSIADPFAALGVPDPYAEFMATTPAYAFDLEPLTLTALDALPDDEMAEPDFGLNQTNPVNWTEPLLNNQTQDPHTFDLTAAWNAMIDQQASLLNARSEAHEAYLAYSQGAQHALAKAALEQSRLHQLILRQAGPAALAVQAPPALAPQPAPAAPTHPVQAQKAVTPPAPAVTPTPQAVAPAAPAAPKPVASAQPVAAPAPAVNQTPGEPTRKPLYFGRELCLEFARGKIVPMLGPDFAEVDTFPTRVRLPDEPLMLVDRVIDMDGVPMTRGFVITEHDVLHDGWYLDAGRIATCVAIEAGQADLLLSAYLHADFQTRGLSMYRLLDARVTFHDDLPKAGQVIRYDIYIDSFFRQGDTHFFRFRFDGTVNGKPLLTMREGVAGFFSKRELDSGKGIVKAVKDRSRAKRSADWVDFVPMEREQYSRQQLTALRNGDLAGCFGPQFANLPLTRPFTLPSGLMELVDRVTCIDPTGGEYGMGFITAQMDIQPDDWFLTCHFVGDEVMPGTLMYECCLHTLRVFLMRQGWVGEAGQVESHPIIGVSSKLLCRGQVLADTKTVTYEVHIREMGYSPEPYCIADAYMYSDQKCIVDITDMCLRFAGLSLEKLKATWSRNTLAPTQPALVMDYDRIYALANGNPSVFGERFKPFDQDRRIARFPRPPFLFMHRVIATTCTPYVLQDKVTASVVYDVPPDAWYFAADRQNLMPYAILLEIALQACGWSAAYMGCALLSSDRLLFRNLGGNGTLHLPIEPNIGSLTTHITVTSVSKTKEVILLFFEFRVESELGLVYEGDTYFGFFSEPAMANQAGVTDHDWYAPTEQELSRGETFPYPTTAPFSDDQMRMMDQIDLFLPAGGRYGLGYIEGSLAVRPDLWFFQAHFYQDPVWPGSLGLEAFQQLLKVYLARYFQLDEDTQFQSTNLATRHTWIYRGQVVPTNKKVTVQANVKEIDEETRTVFADGYLMVDGMVIYQIKDFGLSAL